MTRRLWPAAHLPAHLWDDGVVGGGGEVVHPGGRQGAAVRHDRDELALLKRGGGVAVHVEALAHLRAGVRSGYVP